MKNLVLFILLTTSVTAQNANEIITYFEDGTIKEKGVLDSEGKKQGLWKSYNESQGIWIISNYFNGILDGEYFEYYPGNKNGELGILRLKANYQNGNLVGEWDLLGRHKGIYYINENNISVEDGEWLSYDFDGNLKEKTIWDKGKELRYITYHKNGNILSEYSIESDSTKEYFDNGKIKLIKYHPRNISHSINYYKNGKLESDVYRNYLSGDFIYKSYYENGKPEHLENNEELISYYENGQLKEKGSFSSRDVDNFVKTGIWESYYENGQLKEKNQFDLEGNNIGWGEEYFENGLLKSKIFYSELETKEISENEIEKIPENEIEKIPKKGSFKSNVESFTKEQNTIVGAVQIGNEIKSVEIEDDKIKIITMEGKTLRYQRNSGESNYSYVTNFKENKSKSKMIPVYPGCENSSDPLNCFQTSLTYHINQNFKYPELAIRDKLEGRVNVTFTISKNGSITNILTEGPYEVLENETRRIISILPEMIPGVSNGEKVDVPYSTYLVFKLPLE